MKQIDIWNKNFSEKKYNYAEYSNRCSWLIEYIDLFQEMNNETVVDLGCGDGYNTMYLYNAGVRNIIACDIASSALEEVKHLTGNKVATCCFDMSKEIPFANSSVGIVVASLSIQYFSLNDSIKIFKKIYNCLKPGGYLIFRVNNLNQYYRNKTDDTVRELGHHYYESINGKNKFYYDENDIDMVRGEFKLISLKEVEFIFADESKLAYEVVFQKNLC